MIITQRGQPVTISSSASPTGIRRPIQPRSTKPSAPGGLAITRLGRKRRTSTREAGAEGLRLAARYTARLAFLLFLPVYLASAWHRLAPGALSRLLLARRRALGLAFATAQAIHLAALGAALRAAGQAPDAAAAGVGGAAFAATFAMAATSNDAAVRRLGRHGPTLHGAGLHLVSFSFAFTYATRLARDPVWFAPFAALALAALAARLLAPPRRRPAGRAG